MTISLATQRWLTFAAITLVLAAATTAHAMATLTIALAPGVDPNGEPQYTAVVKNIGSVDAPNLTVTYTMPVGELPISPPPSGGCLFTPGPSHLVAVCKIDHLAPGVTQNFVVAIHPIDTAPQDVSVLATEDGGGSASASTTSTITAVGLTEMLVTMTSTNPGKVGEALVYNVTVTNIQDDDARNVFAVLALPAKTQFVSGTKGCTRSTLITCKLGQMSPGTSKTVTITVLPTVSGWTQATAGVRLTTPDGHAENNSAATSIWINP